MIILQDAGGIAAALAIVDSGAMPRVHLINGIEGPLTVIENVDAPETCAHKEPDYETIPSNRKVNGALRKSGLPDALFFIDICPLFLPTIRYINNNSSLPLTQFYDRSHMLTGRSINIALA